MRKRTRAADRRRLEVDRVGRVDDLGVQLEVLEDPVEQRERALDLDLDVEQLAEREEQPALERREGDDVAGASARRGCRWRPCVPASQYTNAGMIQKIVPMIMKNQRPTIAWRIWSTASARLSTLNRSIDRSCCAERLGQQDPRHRQRLLGHGAHLGEATWVSPLTSRRTLPTRKVRYRKNGMMPSESSGQLPVEQDIAMTVLMVDREVAR